MAHGEAWEGEWIASTLHTTSEHGLSSITTAVVHTLAASSRPNWRPRRYKWTLVSPRDENWLLLVCLHISTDLYLWETYCIVLLAKYSAASSWASYPLWRRVWGGGFCDVRRCWSKVCRSNGDELREERSWCGSPSVLPCSGPRCKGDKTADRDHFSACHADQIRCLPTSVFWASRKVSRCQIMIGWLCVLDVDLFAKGFDALVSVGCKCLSRCVLRQSACLCTCVNAIHITTCSDPVAIGTFGMPVITSK